MEKYRGFYHEKQLFVYMQSEVKFLNLFLSFFVIVYWYTNIDGSILGGGYQRLFMISYLDEEILVSLC